MAISAGQEFGSSRPQPSPVRSDSDHRVRVVDRRGLPTAAAVMLAIALAFFGGAVDAATGSGLRTLFAICFVGGSMLAALLVRQTGLLATVVMPPLVYVAVALAAAGLQLSDTTGSFLTQELLELATALVTGAPVLVIGTLLTAAVAGVRWVGYRRRVVAAQSSRSGPPLR